MSDSGNDAAAVAPRLPAAVRRQRIQQMLKSEGFISVAKIANLLGVSTMSVRRDLDELAKAGELVRSYGTAMPSQPASAAALPLDESELQYETRRRRNGAAKEAIARTAARLIEPGHMIALDVGSTVHSLAREISGHVGLRVFTNHLRVASMLAATGCEVVVPGGTVRAKEMSICGAAAVDQVRSHWFNQAFIGVSGLNEEGGFDYSWDDSEVKRAYIERCDRCIVLCDSSKFERKSVARVCRLGQIGLLVTDAAPPPALAAALEREGVEVMVA
ncbi:MAG: DeoR/GlpR transcriptional regulator [Burkholderiales bacterium]|nr:DeoR/GlpR transcriptional regulator [Burkholderiales bacterium]MDE2453492.1 DeoR/GlpR transcriptional regulator [Burkholderiales bacterium]